MTFMIGWNVIPIKKLGRVVTGKTPPTGSQEYYGGDELFVSPKDLTRDSCFVYETETKITSRALEKFKGQVIPKNSVMFTSLSFAFGKMGITSRPCITNQQISTVVANEEHNYRFVYYLLRTYESIIFSYNSGIDTPIVPKSVFEKIQVRCPNLDLQEKIAAVLSAYDDLIDNNRRRIELLERMAEELYREWFVRFRFPGYQQTKFEKGVPVGWKQTGLGSLGTYLNGYAFKPSDLSLDGIPVIKIKEINGGVTAETPRNSGESIAKKYHFDDGAIIFSWSATLAVKVWDQGTGLLNQHLFKVTPTEGVPSSFLYLSIKFCLPIFDSLTTGSTMKHIKRKELDAVKIGLPGKTILEEFDRSASTLLREKLKLSKANQLLVEARNQLLTRLISGKLPVDQLDIQFPSSMREADEARQEVVHA
ncbi:restriction endonuclease subunit S [Pseudomonas brassicacearum subsp. neoaurantiaca]|uniref:restriction endonuclease subunit S n=1 Tax=Pseudomonas brassicacearum TaxID=930166 RepID=UPI0040354107